MEHSGSLYANDDWNSDLFNAASIWFRATEMEMAGQAFFPSDYHHYAATPGDHDPRLFDFSGFGLDWHNAPIGSTCLLWFGILHIFDATVLFDDSIRAE